MPFDAATRFCWKFLTYNGIFVAASTKFYTLYSKESDGSGSSIKASIRSASGTLAGATFYAWGGTAAEAERVGVAGENLVRISITA